MFKGWQEKLTAMDDMRRNNLPHWFLKILNNQIFSKTAGVKSLIRMPDTEIVATNLRMSALLDDQLLPSEWDELRVRCTEAIETVGLPCFLKTGQTSDKHSWRGSCYLTKFSDLRAHIFALTEFSACHDLSLDCFVFRRLIPTKPVFFAFNEMPITREFRFFANSASEQVYHVQPYWPKEAIEGHTQYENWAKNLEEMNILKNAEFELLSEMALEAVKIVEGDWSIDFLQDVDGNWWLIDMALAHTSFKYESEILRIMKRRARRK